MSILRKIMYEKFLRRINVLMRCSTDTGGIISIIRESTSAPATIYALASGQGKCGVAVVRVSGSKASDALKKMTTISQLEARKVYLRKIFDPITGEVIDKGLCFWFPGPYSFTGEDTVEFQVHGGSAILEALMIALSNLKFQLALPGEFTKRAFYNGKLDLTEVEGLADLIHAETEQQRRQALLQADGNLSKLYNNWRDILSKSLAHIEAYIDFSEDDNIEDGVLENCNDTIGKLFDSISKHLADGRRGEILRNGIRTVIIGQPNVGKSSLLNYLVQRNAAIVTPIAGTTRDIVELNTNILGYPVILADTAGLTKFTDDVVELEGIKRAKIHANDADFIILMVDASVYHATGKSFKDYIDNYVNSLEIEKLLTDSDSTTLPKNHIIVVNKIDLIDHNEDIKKDLKECGVIAISCVEENGFQDLMEALEIKFRNICGNPSRENPTISQTRHRMHLTKCCNYLEIYLNLCERSEYDMVIAAQQIRNAMRELGKITGHASTEEILDIIFSNFCIGK